MYILLMTSCFPLSQAASGVDGAHVQAEREEKKAVSKIFPASPASTAYVRGLDRFSYNLFVASSLVDFHILYILKTYLPLYCMIIRSSVATNT